MRALLLVVVTAVMGGRGWSVRINGMTRSRGWGHSTLVMLLVLAAGLQTATPPEDIEGLEQAATLVVAVFAMVGGVGCGAADFVFSTGGVGRMVWVRCLGGGFGGRSL